MFKNTQFQNNVIFIALFYCLCPGMCWSINFERVEFNIIKTCFGAANCSITRVNRTLKGLSCYATVDRDLPDLELEIKLYGAYSNEYRLLPLKYKIKICSYLKFDFKFLKDELKGNIPYSCPVKKGFYYFKDFVPDVKKFPRNPWQFVDKFMVYGHVYYEGIPEASADGKIYFSISDYDEYKYIT